MIRSTTRAVARALLPAPVKRWLNPWRFGGRAPSAIDPPGPLIDPEGAVWIPPDIRLRVGDRLRAELSDHLVHHADSRDEMAGFLAEARRHPGVLFDVGAHQGIFGLVFCAARPDNTAHLYDPSPAAIDVACAALAANGFAARAKTHAAAVGARSGSVRMTVEPSGFAAHVGDAPTAAVFDSPVVTIDDEWRRQGVAPTVIKVDTEGDELDVLRGAEGVLESARPVLFLELHLDLLDARGSSARELCGVLARHNYRLYSPLGRRLLPVAVHQSLRAVLRIVARPREAGAP